jgi:hypothetical protein
MAVHSRQARFLLRASALLILMLGAWWLALQRPMLFLLRPSVEAVLALVSGASSAAIMEGTSEEWNFRVPVTDGTPAKAPGYQSIEFTLQRSDIFAFTLSLPVYWAAAIAMSGLRGNLRSLLAGTAVVSAAEVISVVLLAKTIAYSILAQLHQSNVGVAQWARELSYYLLTLVTPYAVPILVAVWLDRGFREQMFSQPKLP